MKKITNLLLTYPAGYPAYYTKLKPFFIELFNLIPNEINLHIIVNNITVSHELEDLVHRPFNPIIAQRLNDIWLRDFMGFPMDREVVKPIYFPDYLSKLNTSNQINRVQESSTRILDQLGFMVGDMELVWDGGNLVTNGTVGFITEKILYDNPDFSLSEMQSRIEYALKIKPVFIPKVLNDPLGHSDGYMAFVDQDTLAISSYPDRPYLRRENEYLEELRKIVRKEGLEIIEINDYPVDEKYNAGEQWIASAKGCYINYLKLNNTIILPNFQLPRTAPKYYHDNKERLEAFGYQVVSIDATQLSELGGVLHCISWEW